MSISLVKVKGALLEHAFAAHCAGDLDGAETRYRTLLQKEPNNADGLHLLGLIYKTQNKLAEAETLIKKALSLRPDFAIAWYNLGNLYLQKNESALALSSYREAIKHLPNYPEAHYNIGNLLRDIEDYAGALAAYSQAIALKPDYFEARHNRANLLRDLGRTAESIDELKHVVAQKPELPEAHYNLALSLFSQGRYKEGGSHYEYRWKTAGFTSPRRNFTKPVWDGKVQTDITLLLYAEQGLGDTLQFVRFVQAVRPKVGQVIVEVPPHLHRLISHSLGDLAHVVKQGHELPPFDKHAALMSLPWLLGFNIEDIPAPIPYLKAEQGRVQMWAQRLNSGLQRGLRVGLNWQGNPHAKIDKGRSLPLRLLEPLSRLVDVRLISLQKNAGVEQLDTLPHEMRVERLKADYDSGADAFIDAAAVLENIDVLVTTDTALAHLAGALGRPTLLLLKKVPDWRWRLEGETTPWYPTMRLFRQNESGQWEQPILALAKALESWQR